MRWKGSVAIVSGLLAVVAGLYLSGWVTLKLLGLESVPLQWNTWWTYFKALDLPQVAPYVIKIKLGGAIGFGLPLLAWVLLLVPICKTKRRSTHGDARFAVASDLRRQGIFSDDPTGIIVGKFKGRFLKLAGARHALLAAPTRSGKGVGCAIPNLLNFPHSVVVLDVKKEAFVKTSGYRATLGAVFLFDPFASDGHTHRWNPLSYVDTHPDQRVNDLQAIAACFYPDNGGHDPFWAKMSRTTFVAAASYLFDEWQYKRTLGYGGSPAVYPTLGGVYRLLAGDGKDTKHMLQRLIRQSFVDAGTRLEFANITSLAEQTFTSVIATTQAPLTIFANRLLDEATSGNDFWLTDLRRQVQAIYVGIAPAKLSEASTLLNLFFEQSIKLNGSTLPEQDTSLKYQCLFILDEFTALGRVDIVISAVGWMAGYGVRILCIIQSISQLEAVYGVEAARGMVTNLACHIVFAPREQRDAEDYSRMLGDTTVMRKQYHRGQGGPSYTEVEERRALMLPQEIKAMSPKKLIVFIEGVEQPIIGEKIFYYDDSFFKSRLLSSAIISSRRRAKK